MTTLYQRMRETDPARFEELKQQNRERSRLWREQHKDQAKTYMKSYMERYRQNEDNCVRIRKRATDWYNDNVKRAMVSRAQRRAVSAGLEFNITEDDFEIPAKCPIYGIDLNPVRHGRNQPTTPSLDRIDNTRGYVKGNVHVISLRANKHKSDASPEEILMLAEWIKTQL